MQHFSVSPLVLFSNVVKHRHLIWTLTQREILGRYRGSLLGMMWSFFHPVFMLMVYTFVFSVVLKARWTTGSESRTEFALVLFAGLLVFNLFVECVNRAPGLILSNVNYVKKVVFPLEILPVVALGSAIFHLAIGLGAWLAFYLLFFGLPHPTALLLPIVLLPLALFTLGLTWLLASLGVYLRDVAQVTGVVTAAMMFLSPVFYPITALPAEHRYLLMINPLTPVIEQTRAVLMWGEQPDWPLLGIYTVLAMLVAALGFAWFQKTRKGFADVL